MCDWISVKEKKPKAKEVVLFCADFDGKLLHCYGYKDNDDPDSNLWLDITESDCDGYPLDVYTVTHWLPLPTLPTI